MRFTILFLLFPFFIIAQDEVELMFQKGHHEPICAIAQSPDGKILATGGTDLTIRFLDIESGIEFQTFRGKRWNIVDEDARIASLEFSKDGQYLLCSIDSDVLTEFITIRMKDFKVMFVDPNQRNSNIVGGFFTPDGKSVVYCHSLQDKYLKIHDLETHETKTKDLSHMDDKNPENPLLSLYWSALQNKVPFTPNQKNLLVFDRTVINNEITIITFIVDAETLKPSMLVSLKKIPNVDFKQLIVPSKDSKHFYTLPIFKAEGWNKIPWYKHSLETGLTVDSFPSPMTKKNRDLHLDHHCMNPEGLFIYTYKDSIYISEPGDPTIKKVWFAKTEKGNTDQGDIKRLGKISTITSSVDGKSVFLSFAGKNKQRRSHKDPSDHGDFLPDYITIRQIDLATGHVIKQFVSLGKMINAVSFDPKGKSLLIAENKSSYHKRSKYSLLSAWNFKNIGTLPSIYLSGERVNQFIYSPYKKECFIEYQNFYGAGMLDLKKFIYNDFEKLRKENLEGQQIFKSPFSDYRSRHQDVEIKINTLYNTIIDEDFNVYKFDKAFESNRYVGKLELPDKKFFRGKPILNFLNEGKEVAVLTEGVLEDYKNITTPCKLHFYDLATTKKTGELAFDEYFFAIYEDIETAINKDETLFAFATKQIFNAEKRDYEKGQLYIIDPIKHQIKTKILLESKDCFTWDRIHYKTGKKDQIDVCAPVKVTQLRFSPDSKLILGGSGDNSIKVWDVVTGKEVKTLKGHLNLVTDISFHPKKALMASASEDGQIIFWNTDRWTIIAKMVVIGREDYIIYTNQGYYMATHKAVDRVAFKKGGRFFGIEQFDLKYNRPDIVMDSLDLASSFMIRTLKKAYEKRLRHLGYTEEMLNTEFHVPTLKLNEALPFEVDNSSLEFNVDLEDSKEELKQLNVYVNDVPIYGLQGKSLKGSKKTKKIQLDLSKGLNYLTLSVTNNKGTESMQKKMVINNTQTKKTNNLHLLVVGVSEYEDSTHNLIFSAKDANDIKTLFTKQSEHYDSIHIQSLTNQEATVPKVLAALKKLQESKVDDEIIVFFSCHGLLDKELNYYLAMHKTDFDNPTKGGLSYRRIEEALALIPARKRLLFMDACHSGEVDKTGLTLEKKESDNKDLTANTKGGKYEVKAKLNNSFAYMKALFSDMGKGTGTTIISAAGGAQFALEANEWGNGVFTYSILKGINSKDADLNRDKQVNIDELQKYVTSMVNELTDGKQLPTTRHVNRYGNFSIYKY